MDSLEGLQKRIKTTQDLRSIVSTMKSLSAVSIIQYDAALKSLLEYGRTIDTGVVGLMRNGVVNTAKPPKQSSERRRALAVIIGSDTGLVGKINRDVVSFAKKTLTDKGFDLEKTAFIAIGRQIIGQLEREGNPMLASYPVSNSIKAISTTASAVLIKIDEVMQPEKISHVYLFYSQKRGTSVKPNASLLVPMGEGWLEDLKKEKWNSRRFPTFTMPAGALFSSLVQERLLIELSTAVTDALTAEHHTRLMTMQAAEKNIDENLERMNLEYQQKRQENITTELLDVVSGAEALRSKEKKTRSRIVEEDAAV